MPPPDAVTDPTRAVLAYHQVTKHHPHRFARSLGYLDWDTQPDPFRRYAGAPLLSLDEMEPAPGPPSYDEIFSAGLVPEAPLDRAFVSQLFFDSLALSAWKEAGQTRWSLRVNPSSGNLHPTEGYLLCPAIGGMHPRPAICHYSPFLHALEVRAQLDQGEWEALCSGLPAGTVLMALTSIHWREAWKYGERAYRYCQHDLGHALGAIAVSAATLGWRARLLESVPAPELARLLGVRGQDDIEGERADCLLALFPSGRALSPAAERGYRLPAALLERLDHTPFAGARNRLSPSHHEWPILDAVAGAAQRRQPPGDAFWHPPEAGVPEPAPASDAPAARVVIRRRRSAVAMDGQTGITLAAFAQMMRRILPGRDRLPFATLPWRPRIHPVVFVHRVQDLDAGLYLLVRDPSQREPLRAALSPRFRWERPAGLPDDLPLWCLETGDCRAVARGASCGQDIAADGCFAVAMLAELEGSLTRLGPWFYPRLHWEAGLLGQVLYLEAEAAGIRSTGIGCFLDDVVHELLGLRDATFQTLYHFTVGGALDDPRLRTLPAYAHRRPPEP